MPRLEIERIVVEPNTQRTPRIGMLAKIRNRRGVIASVEPFDGAAEGRLHLVRLEYIDSDGFPEETILWERENSRDLLEPNALPRVQDEPRMDPSELDALVRATRWAALRPFLEPRGSGGRSALSFSAPFFGAVQVDDFQLVPSLHALRMPRVSILLADDVGLGKTVEAGLILTELLLRRRIRRVLVLTPASLKNQWQEEMKLKFALSFDQVDRQETHQLQRRLGLDANPWRVFPRIIASYHYLRQPDVCEQFLATCRHNAETKEVRAQLPWDLLIVDEAHNLMPSSFGRDSLLVDMLRTISPYFEHKLFLTATPHNGHTRSFSGLLEVLDPVRFTRTAEFKPDERARVGEVVVRRLKSEINDLDRQSGRVPRFADRTPSPVPLYFAREERTLALAAFEFRKAVKTLVASSAKSEQLAGSFAIEILTKRLLSGPYTFAESWHRFKAGATSDASADVTAVSAAKKSAEEDLDDDQEIESRAFHAVQTVGAWMRPFVGMLAEQISRIDKALEALGMHQVGTLPSYDERFDRLHRLIEDRLREGKHWRPDERLIVFTEYKTTLDYLHNRLALYPDHEQRIKVIYGNRTRGGREDRDKVIKAFNDSENPVRVLIATDVASEGLNLQETARYVMHWDIPWNPSRLEQRNGRVDRHGQARNVTVFHFTSDDDADLHFISHVVAKVHEIREDLGSVGEIFDAAFERRFSDLSDTEDLLSLLDKDVEASKDHAVVPRTTEVEDGKQCAAQLTELARHVDLTPTTLRETLDVALGIGVGRPRIEGPDAKGRMKLRLPLPPQWESLIDDTLRLPTDDGRLGPLPQIVFDPDFFIDVIEGRPVFRPSKDTVLLHLGHPLFRCALTRFARLRFPGGDEAHPISRWTVRIGPVPEGMDGLIALTAEEFAVNELREPFHHWVRTHRFGFKSGDLVGPLAYCFPGDDIGGEAASDESAVRRAREMWSEVDTDVRTFVKKEAQSLTKNLEAALLESGAAALKDERERFSHRLKEVQRAMAENSIAKIEKERSDLQAEMRQRSFLADREREQEARLANLNEELELRTHRFRELLEILRLEQTRVLEEVVPRRHKLRGQAQVFPVAVEIRLPEEPC